MLLTSMLFVVGMSLPQEIESEALRAVVEPYLKQNAVPGAVIGILVSDQADKLEAFGLADVKTKAPMLTSTRFQVGSVTKPVTAGLIAKLAEDGLLSFDDPISSHWPEGVELPESLASITLGELMTHSSGLPREPINRVNLPDSPSVMLPMSNAELCAGLQRTELQHPRGESWAYSNLGYAVLGVVAGEAGGLPYDQLLSERVLTPLGMLQSAVYVNGDKPVGLASCYWPEDEQLIERDPWRFGSASAFSGLVSDGADLMIFLRAQMDSSEDAFFSEESLAFLHAPTVSIDQASGRAMAPGWFVDPMPGGLVAIGHGGELDGHSAVIAFFPGLKAGLVVLCNKGGKAAENLAFACMGVLLPKLLERNH